MKPSVWPCSKIENPRILLLDCPLEYKKGENQTNVEVMREEDWCVPPPPSSMRAPLCTCLVAACGSAHGKEREPAPCHCSQWMPPSVAAGNAPLRRPGSLALTRCRATLLKMEEEWIQKTCDQIVAFKPDVVITGGSPAPVDASAGLPASPAMCV